MLMRLWLNESGGVLQEIIYEYDSQGRCMSGVVLDGKKEVLGSFEHIYTREYTDQIETVERDAHGSVLNRIQYVFDLSGRPIKAIFFNREENVGYEEMIYDQNGELVQTHCYTNAGVPVERLELERVGGI